MRQSHENLTTCWIWLKPYLQEFSSSQLSSSPLPNKAHSFSCCNVPQKPKIWSHCSLAIHISPCHLFICAIEPSIIVLRFSLEGNPQWFALPDGTLVITFQQCMALWKHISPAGSTPGKELLLPRSFLSTHNICVNRQPPRWLEIQEP